MGKPGVRQPEQTTNNHPPEVRHGRPTDHAQTTKYGEHADSKAVTEDKQYKKDYDRPESNESGISVSSSRLFKQSPLDSYRSPSFQSPRSPANVNLKFPYRKDVYDF